MEPYRDVCHEAFPPAHLLETCQHPLPPLCCLLPGAHSAGNSYVEMNLTWHWDFMSTQSNYNHGGHKLSQVCFSHDIRPRMSPVSWARHTPDPPGDVLLVCFHLSNAEIHGFCVACCGQMLRTRCTCTGGMGVLTLKQRMCMCAMASIIALSQDNTQRTA